MTCGINSGFKMFISVRQCMKSTFKLNNEIFICRKFNTLKKGLRPVSLIRLSHPSKKNKAICEKNGSNILLRKPQFVVPLDSNLYSNNNGNPVVPEKGDEKKSQDKVSLYARLKKMYKEYWYVLLPVHLLTSSFWFGSFYYLASSGIDIPTLMQSLGAPDSWVESLRSSKAGHVVVAYTLYKVATPLRYTCTLGATTLTINYLKKNNWIKPVPNTELIKKLYQQQKGAFMDKMQVAKTGFLKNKYEMKKQVEKGKEEFHELMYESRRDLKQGAEAGIEEWKIITKLFSNCIKNLIKSGKKNSH